MASHHAEQSMSSSSFKPDISDALRNRQGCEVAHALKGMTAGEQLDAIRGYQRESKQDPQHYPKIDVNFDKNGYEIKAKPNAETNDSAKPNKSESILNHKMDENDNTTSLSCKNETMKPVDAMQHMGGRSSDSSNGLTQGGSLGTSMDGAGMTKPSLGGLGDSLATATATTTTDLPPSSASQSSDSQSSKHGSDAMPPADPIGSQGGSGQGK
jgi:hypothetical protein